MSDFLFYQDWCVGVCVCFDVWKNEKEIHQSMTKWNKNETFQYTYIFYRYSETHFVVHKHRNQFAFITKEKEMKNTSFESIKQFNAQNALILWILSHNLFLSISVLSVFKSNVRSNFESFFPSVANTWWCETGVHLTRISFFLSFFGNGFSCKFITFLC